MSKHPTLICVEPLETRRLMSASPVFLAGGTLFINGRGAAENSITVTLADENTVSVTVSSIMVATAKVKSSALTFSRADVQMVMVRGGKLADDVSVGNLDAGWTIPVVVHSGAGDDRVETGGGNDLVMAADGNDTVNAGDGNNIVNGGKGEDTLATGGGDDMIAGGNDRDIITAGAGNDYVRAGEGDDVVNLGEGNDYASGQLGNDVLRGEAGNDILWGGRGDDVIYGGDGDDLLGGVLDYNTLDGGEGQDTFVMMDLDANSHDYDELEDILRLSKKKTDGDVVDTL